MNYRMILDEAIAHEREVAKDQKSKYDECITRMRSDCLMCFHKCNEISEYHEQIAEWLEELKAYIEIGTVEECRNSVLDIPKAYNKAIDDFVNACKEDILCQTFGLSANGIERIAEQLKAGVESE